LKEHRTPYSPERVASSAEPKPASFTVGHAGDQRQGEEGNVLQMMTTCLSSPAAGDARPSSGRLNSGTNVMEVDDHLQFGIKALQKFV